MRDSAMVSPGSAGRSRRSAMGLVGRFGLGLSMGALAGLFRERPALAQSVPIDPLQPLRALFEFNVRQGLNAGLKMSGDLDVQIGPAGAISGTWRLIDGSVIQVVGQATGRAVNLVLTLADGRRVFGVGTADEPIGGAPTIIGGLGNGPGAGDFADWLMTIPTPATSQVG